MFRWGQSMKIPVKATSERQYTLDRYADARFSLVSGDVQFTDTYICNCNIEPWHIIWLHKNQCCCLASVHVFSCKLWKRSYETPVLLTYPSSQPMTSSSHSNKHVQTALRIHTCIHTQTHHDKPEQSCQIGSFMYFQTNLLSCWSSSKLPSKPSFHFLWLDVL